MIYQIKNTPEKKVPTNSLRNFGSKKISWKFREFSPKNMWIFFREEFQLKKEKLLKERILKIRGNSWNSCRISMKKFSDNSFWMKFWRTFNDFFTPGFPDCLYLIPVKSHPNFPGISLENSWNFMESCRNFILVMKELCSEFFSRVW